MPFFTQDIETQNFDIRVDPIMGRTVFTKVAFSEGSHVCHYRGDVFGSKEFVRRERLYDNEPEKYGSYVLQFRHGQGKYAIDATHAFGSVGCLINHSIAKQNIAPVKYTECGQLKVHFVAKRNIAVNEELFYDYGDRSDSSIAVHKWLSK